jgi:hypothetical protein
MMSLVVPWLAVTWAVEREWLWEEMGGQVLPHCLRRVLRLRWLDYS